MTYRYFDGRRWTDEYGGPVRKGVGRGTIIAGALGAVVVGAVVWSGVVSACERISEPQIGIQR